MQTHNKYKFPFIHRFLHWTIALAILFMLLTVFLRLGWMNKESVGQIILENLHKKNITITQEEAQSIAKNIRKPMFQWHIYIGYALIGLYFMRLLYILIKGNKFREAFSKLRTIKQRFQSITYILFYLVLGITLLSGFLIVNGPEEYKEQLEEIHKSTLYFMIAFLLLHFTGIFIGERTTQKGIVSAMINGGDQES